MKRSIITPAIAMLFVLLAMDLSAQYSVGVRAGLNRANVYFEETALDPTTRYRNMFSAAVFAEIPIENGFYFQPEIAYTQKGFLFREGYDFDVLSFPVTAGISARTKIDYIEAPMLLKYKADLGAVKLYAMAGPYAGYAQQGEVRLSTNFIVEIPVYTYDIPLSSNTYQRWEFGAAAGAGIAIPLGPVEIFTEGRYQTAFTNFFKDPIVEGRMKNHGFQWNFGVSVPLN